MPGPMTSVKVKSPSKTSRDAPARNADCETCHPTITAEWRGSLHQQSYRDPEFLRAFRREPLPFCRGCHAPEADPRRPPPAELADLGVGCVTCHQPEEELLAAPRDEPREPGPHALRRAPAFAGVDACAGCHEFPFPGRGADALMQRTIQEHAASPARARPCADCHMPLRTDPERGGAPYRAHDFRSTRDLAQLRAAVSIEARRPAPDRVELTLTTGDVGHAVPTGDLNRRLAVTVRVIDPVRARPRQHRYLGRRFEARPGPGGVLVREEVADERVFPGEPKRVRFELAPEDAELAVEWSVTHQRVESFLSADERSAVIAGELEIAAGRLDPAPSDIIQQERSTP